MVRNSQKRYNNNVMKRYLTFLQRALRLATLGATPVEKMRVFTQYLTLSLRRLLGLPYAALPLRRVDLRFNEQTFPFYYRGLLDFYILEGAFIEQECDTNPTQSPRIIFDLGSNTGATVLYFKLKYPEATIYAFEPDPDNVAVLRENTKWCSKDVHIFSGALSNKSVSAVDFYIGKEHWSSSLASRDVSDHVISIETITLDDAMKQYGVTHIDIMKFDIEGAEYDVFEHFVGLSQVQQLVGEIHLDLLDSRVEDFWHLFNKFSIQRRPVHNHRLTAVFNRA